MGNYDYASLIPDASDLGGGAGAPRTPQRDAIDSLRGIRQPATKPVGPAKRNAYADLIPDEEELSQASPGVAPKRGIYDSIIKPGLEGFGEVAGAPKRVVDTAANYYAGLPDALNPHVAPIPTGELMKEALFPHEDAAPATVAGIPLPSGSAKSSYAKSIGREAVGLGTDLLSDPVTWGLGPVGEAGAAGTTAEAALKAGLVPEAAAAAAKVARVGKIARPFDAALGAAFTGQMGIGAYQEGKAAYESLVRDGFTPDVAAEIVRSAASAGFAGLGLHHMTGRAHGERPYIETPEEKARGEQMARELHPELPGADELPDDEFFAEAQRKGPPDVWPGEPPAAGAPPAAPGPPPSFLPPVWDEAPPKGYRAAPEEAPRKLPNVWDGPVAPEVAERPVDLAAALEDPLYNEAVRRRAAEKQQEIDALGGTATTRQAAAEALAKGQEAAKEAEQRAAFDSQAQQDRARAAAADAEKARLNQFAVDAVMKGMDRRQILEDPAAAPRGDLVVPEEYGGARPAVESPRAAAATVAPEEVPQAPVRRPLSGVPEGTNPRVGVLPDVYERAPSKDAPEIQEPESRRATEGDRSGNSERVPEPREVGSAAMPMRIPEHAEAPRGLQQATGSNVVVPDVSLETAQKQGPAGATRDIARARQILAEHARTGLGTPVKNIADGLGVSPSKATRILKQLRKETPPATHDADAQALRGSIAPQASATERIADVERIAREKREAEALHAEPKAALADYQARRPPTPQVPNAPGTKYVLPSFVTKTAEKNAAKHGPLVVRGRDGATSTIAPAEEQAAAPPPATRPMPESRKAAIIPTRAGVVAVPEERRIATADERRVAAPVASDQRREERRRAIATAVELPEDHPAVERVLKAEEQSAEAEKQRADADEAKKAALRVDPLTGLRSLYAWKEEHPDAADGTPGSPGPGKRMAFIDLAKFKEMNDEIGHDAADKVLKHVAGILSEEVGKENAFRRSGDEFFAVLDEADHDSMQRVMKRLAEAKVEVQNRDGSTTIVADGIRAHLGEGADLVEADRAANASRAAKGRGAVSERAAPVAEPEPQAAVPPESGRENREGVVRPAEEPRATENNHVEGEQRQQEAAEPTGRPTTEPAAPRPSAESKDLVPGTRKLVDSVEQALDGKGIRDNKALTKMAEDAFGGTRGQGRFSPRDAYDALEAGVNRHIENNWKDIGETADGSPMRPDVVLRRLRDVVAKLPTQTDRTQEQVELQQFSTPPTEAFVAAKALDIHPGETVLEPSAGVGSLATMARIMGGDVRTNEISPRRAALLEEQGFKPTRADAELLDDTLPGDVKPTAILMNPPFSATGGRVKAHKTAFGGRHVEQALRRLEPGGRLVAIVGQGMALDRPGFSKWWKKIASEYNVRANIGVPGEEYGKYGTTFGNQLIIIDKTGPTPDWSAIRHGGVKSLEEALDAVSQFKREQPESRPEVLAGRDAGAVGDVRDERSAAPAGGVVREPGRARSGGDRVVGGGDVPARSDEALPGSESRPGVEEPSAVTEAAIGRPGDSSGEHVRPGAAGTDPVVAAPALEPDPIEKPIEDDGSAFVPYRPARLGPGFTKHPADIVEAASMAGVEPPAIAYKPSFPPEVVKEGRLSDVGYESVAYAGQRHEQVLPSGQRAGYFVGDGTGVGKGRIVAGIVYDNHLQGRKRALWVSVSRDLHADAKRDIADVAGEHAADIPVKLVNDYAPGDDIDMGHGVVFSTYSSLVAASKGQNGQTRRQQIEKWLGKDGVIVFDEAHAAKNLLGSEGPMGSEGSKRAQAVVDLQNNLPDARVTYVSATGATDVKNMAYMTRLGLWGEGTPFPKGFDQFLVEIGGGGVGAMEMVARDLKALGMYNSRSISYKGVEYRERVHELTDPQRQMYSTAAKAWQTVLQNIEKAVDVTNGGKQARTRAMSQFWSAQQRFFNQLITAIKVPTAIDETEKALKAGKSVVLALINTGEGRTVEKVAKAIHEGTDLDDLDFTPREVLAQLVDKSFPTDIYEEVTDPQTKQTRRVPVMGEDGKPLQSKAALAMKQQLMDGLSSLSLPDNPLDQIINHFGEGAVAELTGRKKRLIRDQNTGKTEFKTRASKGVPLDRVNLHEMKSFQDGQKRVAIISDAASTGISLHSSRRAENQQKRVHITLQLGWSADKQMQTFGRTHRSDQAHAPEYVLLSTDIGGEKRFSSTIAKRLASLGALTKGQRDATGGGDLSKYNFETNEGASAVAALYGRLMSHEKVPGIEDSRQVLVDMGLMKKDGDGGVSPRDIMDVPRFLNRILALDPDRQNALFDAYSDHFKAAIDNAKSMGTFDEGVSDLKAKAIRMPNPPEVIHTDKTTGAKTSHYELETDNPTTPVTWKTASEAAAGALKDHTEARDEELPEHLQPLEPGFYRNETSGKLSLVTPAGRKTDPKTGLTYRSLSISTPKEWRARLMREDDFRSGYSEGEAQRWTKVDPADARGEWEEQLSKVPAMETKKVHILGGAILPLWERLRGVGLSGMKVVRAVTDEAQRVVGVKIPATKLNETLRAIGVDGEAHEPGDVFKAVHEQGDTVNLVGGMKLRKARVGGEDRIELVTTPSQSLDELRRMGLKNEQIQWKQRFFVPTDESAGVPILDTLLKRYPVAGTGEGAAKPLFDGEAALGRIKKRGRGKAFDIGGVVGEGVSALKDAITYGASLIERGARAFPEWADQMKRDMGAHVQNLSAHLQRLWKAAKARVEAASISFGELENEPKGTILGSLGGGFQSRFERAKKGPSGPPVEIGRDTMPAPENERFTEETIPRGGVEPSKVKPIPPGARPGAAARPPVEPEAPPSKVRPIPPGVRPGDQIRVQTPEGPRDAMVVNRGDEAATGPQMKGRVAVRLEGGKKAFIRPEEILPTEKLEAATRRAPAPQLTPSENVRVQVAGAQHKLKPSDSIPFNLDRMNVSPENKRLLAKEYAANPHLYDQAAGGTQTFDQFRASGLALAQTMSPKEFADAVKAGAPLASPGAVVYAKNVADVLRRKTFEAHGALMAAVAKGRGVADAEADYLAASLEKSNFELAFRGAQAEAARTLVAFKILSENRGAPLEKLIRKIFNESC